MPAVDFGVPDADGLKERDLALLVGEEGDLHEDGDQDDDEDRDGEEQVLYGEHRGDDADAGSNILSAGLDRIVGEVLLDDGFSFLDLLGGRVVVKVDLECHRRGHV